MQNKNVFCSEYFNDIGLKKEAKNIGYKLDTELLDDLCHNFFVLNNTYKFSYGESYYIQYNNSHYNNEDNIIFAENLKNDVEIFRQHLKIGFSIILQDYVILEKMTIYMIFQYIIIQIILKMQ